MLEYVAMKDIFDEEEYLEGSIGKLISYFNKVFKPNDSSVSNLYKSLSKEIRKWV